MINGRHAIRDGEWKLVSTRRQTDAADLLASQFGLYNLTQDSAEKNDLSAAHPERVARLFQEFRTLAEKRTLK